MSLAAMTPAGKRTKVAAAPARLPPVTLILGGARSGKSLYAERLIESQPGPCIYIATAEAADAEMAARIERHRARRGARWRVIEAALALVPALREACGPDRAVLVDCLTLWLANLMGAGRDIAAEMSALLTCLPQLAGPVVLVSNEVGLGIVPDIEAARGFRDHAGILHQSLAAQAQSVAFLVAGIPLAIKTPTEP
jgi:adenosylcobinamide kinase/adenosylcobinamide-phosphate guanylyltransferase